MTWAKRIFEALQQDPQPLSAKRLEIAYQVPHARRELAVLRAHGCIEEAFRVGNERFWRVAPGASPPRDLRIDSGRARIHIALKARRLRQLGKG